MRRLLVLLAFVWAPLAAAQGSVLVVGGGTPPSDAAAWLADRAANGRVIVLDYEPADSSWPARFQAAGAEATYLAVPASDADDPAVADLVRSHDGVFLPGGDQNRYRTQWTGTAVAQAVRDVFARGGAVGGTSAGAMVLGGAVYDARTGGVSARTALRDPAGPHTLLSAGFLSVLPGAVVETHLSERGRLARLLVFAARAAADGFGPLDAVGVDDGTALGVAPDGTAEVLGSGVVAVVRPTHATELQVAPGQPLGLGPVRWIQATAGARLDLGTLEQLDPPAGPVVFVPEPTRALPGPVFLDGRGANWSASSEAFGAVAGASPLVLTGDAGGSSPLAATLSAFAPEVRVLDAASSDSPALADAVASASGIALDLIAPEQAALLAPSTRAGAALRAAVDAGVPLLAVAESAQAVGMATVSGLGDPLASYRGELALDAGSALLGGAAVMPLAWGFDSDFWENRSAGWVWSLAEAGASLGLAVPAGVHLSLQDNVLTAQGEAPVLVADLSGVTSAGVPAVRQNAHLVEATMWAVAPGQTLTLPSAVSAQPVADASSGLRVWPNPVAASAHVELRAEVARDERLVVTDVLGRTVATVFAGPVAPGTRRFELDLTGLAPGVYVVRGASASARLTVRR